MAPYSLQDDLLQAHHNLMELEACRDGIYSEVCMTTGTIIYILTFEVTIHIIPELQKSFYP